jgi:hypothetical protein
MDEKNPDLRAAYRTLDPVKPLEGAWLSKYYVQRPGAPTAKLAEEIKERSQPFRAIIAGQRGAGKTTELNWLKEKLEREGQFVFLLDISRMAATNAATALGFVTAKLAQEGKRSNVEFGGLFEDQAWIGLDFKKTGAVLHAAQLPEITRIAKGVMEAIQRNRGQEPILLLDGWERVTSNAELYPFMNALEGVNCSTVLVTRLSAILESSFNDYRVDWDLTVLPAIPVFTYDRAADQEGASLLTNALEKRAWKQAFQPDALSVIIAACGGVFRELMVLGRHACLLTDLAGKSAVTSVEADAALREERLNNTTTFSPEDRSELSEFLKTERTWADQRMLKQVDQGRIIAYHRDRLWFDVHPMLWPLMGLKYTGTWLWGSGKWTT